jgi:tetratricopeptide (TPR) repeat protein
MRTTAVAAATLLASVAPVWSGPAPWLGVRSPHFIVATDGSQKQGLEVAHQFEQIRGLFQTVFQARVDPGEPILILAVRDEGGMKQLVPGAWERKGGPHPAGIFVSQEDKHYIALQLGAGAVGVGETQPYHVIYHEYVHLLTRLNFRHLPVWLNEGLAEFYGSAQIDDKEIRFGLPLPAHIQRLRATKLLPLREFLDVDKTSYYFNEASRTSIFYAQAWALTHYLMIEQRQQKKFRLLDFVKRLQEGADEQTATRQAFGDLGALESALYDYVSQLRFQALKTQAILLPTTFKVWTMSEAESAALKGDFLMRTGRGREAEALLDEAQRLDPSLGLAPEAMGHLRRHQRRSGEATACFARAAELSPQNYLALYYHATSEAEEGEAVVERHRQELRRAIAINPAWPPALAHLAWIDLNSGKDLPEALDLAKKAADLTLSNPSHALLQARVLAKLGRPEDARRTEEAVLAWTRSDPDALRALVEFYESAERLPDAERAILAAREANPKSLRVSVEAAGFFERHQGWDKAEAVLRDTVATRPDAPEAYATLAGFLDARDRFEEAEGVLRAGLKSQRDSSVLQNQLGYLYAERGVRVEEGLALINKALSTRPDSAAYLDSQGWALFRLGRLEEAERVIAKALTTYESATILDHMGDVLSRRGRRDEALDYWRRALARPALGDLRWPAQKAALERKIRDAVGPEPSPTATP